MKIYELQELVSKQKSLSLDRLVLKMPAPKFRGKYPLRVRTPFGLCRWYPANVADQIVIFPSLSQVRSYIEKALREGDES